MDVRTDAVVLFVPRAGSSALLLCLSPFRVSLLFSSSLRENGSAENVTETREKRIIASPPYGGLQLKLSSRVPKGGKGLSLLLDSVVNRLSLNVAQLSLSLSLSLQTLFCSLSRLATI